MSDILSQILQRKAEEVRAGRSVHSFRDLEELATVAEAPRGFAHAMRAKVAAGDAAVIAEIKKASPSKGLIRADFDAAHIAQSYAEGGASCLSVLTDEDFFQGHADYLMQAHKAVTLPILRKDFMIDTWQVAQARTWGADAILLIVAALSDAQMEELYACARHFQLDVLVEVHDGEELGRALELPGGILGVNNRNLRTFETRLETTLELLGEVPEERVLVTESGIRNGADMQRMMQAGVFGFLIGEHLMRAVEPGAELGRWLAQSQSA
nr:indole-3-glycerol phosphate synthase TrpC [Oceanococcus sp. HetDA_MAG_MS8]